MDIQSSSTKDILNENLGVVAETLSGIMALVRRMREDVASISVTSSELMALEAGLQTCIDRLDDAWELAGNTDV